MGQERKLVSGCNGVRALLALAAFFACRPQMFDDCDSQSECVGEDTPMAGTGKIEPPSVGGSDSGGHDSGIDGGAGKAAVGCAGSEGDAGSVHSGGVGQGDAGGAADAGRSSAGAQAGEGGTAAEIGPEGGGAAGAPDSTVDCSWDRPFDTSVRELSEPFNGILGSESFWMSPDGLDAYFGRFIGATNYDIYRSARDSLALPFSEPELLTEGSLLSWERQVGLTHDQLTMVYQDQSDIFLTKREMVSDDFGPSEKLPSPINGEFRDGEPYLQPDGKGLFFASARAGTSDLYYVPLEGGKPSGDLVALTRLNSDTYDGSPVVTTDGLTLYFQSGKPAQIWAAHRTTPDGDFREIRLLNELDSPGQEYPESVSSDGCTLYYYREVVERRYALYEAHK